MKPPIREIEHIDSSLVNVLWRLGPDLLLPSGTLEPAARCTASAQTPETWHADANLPGPLLQQCESCGILHGRGDVSGLRRAPALVGPHRPSSRRCRPLPLRPRAPTPAWCPAARYHLRRLVTRSETSKLVCTLETFGVSGIGHRADCCTFKLTTDKDKGPLLRVDARRPRHVTVYPAAGLGLFKFQVLWTRMVRAMYSTSTSSAALHTTSQLSGPNSNR